MIKIILKIIAIIFLSLLQLAIFSKFSIFGAIPNLILIIAITLTFRGRFQDGFLVAGLGGMLLDLASPLRFGTYTLLFLIVLFLIHFFLLKVFPTPNLSTSFLIFTGSFIFVDLGIFLFIKTLPALEILPQALIGGLWGVLIYYLSWNIIKPKEEIKIA